VQTIDGRVLGTPRYMAPERIRGSSEIDGRTDLYGDALVHQYLQIVAAQGEPQAALDREGIRLVVIETESPLAAELRRAPAWRQGYADSLASVFERR